MVTICTRLRNEPKVRAIAEAYAGVFYAAGIHPMSAAEEPLVTRGRRWWPWPRIPKFVGIGETGLDYHYTADSADHPADQACASISRPRRKPACR